MNETDFEDNDKKLRTEFCELYNALIQEPMKKEQLQQLQDLKLLQLDYLTDLTIKMMIWGFKPEFIQAYIKIEARNVKLKEVLNNKI